ncbi:ABC transporter substrate-binding protein [Cellulosilyticum sp. I15G10I2]|uniref:ABC transporter substrate-binding protein n=1 Tax=Cellulosilyticum sp. I15G10I2 TaxID=1892843 RepID=UPI000AB3FBC5|nr:ABC transporter substrate-binding protein [Cellulosilyticum sp. I15G10I2]
MNLKKLISTVLTAVMTVTLLVGCGGGSSTDTSVEEKNSGSSTTIRLINGKIEIDEQLKAYAKAYKEKTGVEVVIESIGGGADIASQIKAYLAAGNMPDMFVFGGEGEYQTWKDYVADLSNEPWASDTAVAYVGEDGKTIGFPYAVEGYGLTYNKDLLDKAGIDPAGLTNINAYKEALVKLDSMKDELGITAVVSMAAEAGQMYWSTGNHNFGTYLATGIARDDTTYIDKLKSGEIDRERMTQYGTFVKLLFDYSDKNTLVSGTYDDQLALWAQGKTVFVHQGNWIDPSLPSYNVTFGMGIAPLAFMEEDTDGILADAPSWWAVYNEGKNIPACKDFLNSLASTEDGAKCLVTEAGMISPFASTTIEPTTPLASNLMKWVQAEKTYAWQWTKMPDGFCLNNLGPAYELLARGEVDVDGFVDLMDNAIATLK